MDRILETCVYVIRGSQLEPEILMLCRSIEPNQGRWVPIGGLIRFDESPLQSAIRELLNIGLVATKAIFRGLVTEISPAEDKQWFLFIYVITDFEGQNKNESESGTFSWLKLSELEKLPKPQSDSVFGGKVLDLNRPFYEATMYFDDNIKLSRVDET